MSGKFVPQCGRRLRWGLAGLVVLALAGTAARAWAQASPAPETPPTTTAPAAGGDIVQTGCSSCGAGMFGNLPPLTLPDGAAGPIEGDCKAGCLPNGRQCGCCCNCDNCVGKFFCGIYECICCKDYCY